MARFLNLIGCVLAVAFSANTTAEVVWSDDFTAGDLNRDFPGGAAGIDYATGAFGGSTISVSTLIGNSAPSLAFLDGGGTQQAVGFAVYMNQFAPFTVGPLSTTPLLRVSFDLRVDSFSNLFSSDRTGVKFELIADNSNSSVLVIGFGFGSVDGDAETDVALFADRSLESRPAPTVSNAVGLAGAGWQPGFDFGNFFGSGPGVEQDTNDEFYRVTFVYNSITGVVTGRVTRLSTGESAPLPSGLSFAPGTTFSSDDALDRFSIRCGLGSTQTYIDNLIFEALPTDAEHTVLYGEGDTVPESAGLPAEAVWRKFGAPSVNAEGDVVFTAEWADAAGKGAAVFGSGPTTDELKVIIKRGAAVPGAGTGSLPADAVVTKLRDPMVAANGDVLTPLALAGKGITNANDGALIWSPSSNLAEARVVVHEGQTLAGGKVKTITAAEVGSVGVAFTAVLAGKGITSANDFIACVWTPLGGVMPVAREGQTFDGVTLKHFDALGTRGSAPGHGRGMAALENAPPKLGLLGKFSNGRTAVFALEPEGTPEVFTSTGPIVSGAPADGGMFKALELPAWAGLLTSPVYLGTLENGTKGIFQYDADTDRSQPVAMVGTEIEPGIRLKSAKGPLVSSNGTRKAWVGTVKGATVTSANDQVVVFADGASVSIVVREGMGAEAPSGARWKSVKGLAMLANGPLLLGTLQRGPGGITGANDVGVWGMDNAGLLRSLFREGDAIGGKKLKTHTVLKAVGGMPGVSRSWNDAGEVVWLASFTDGSSAIVKTQVP